MRRPRALHNKQSPGAALIDQANRKVAAAATIQNKYELGMKNYGCRPKSCTSLLKVQSRASSVRIYKAGHPHVTSTYKWRCLDFLKETDSVAERIEWWPLKQ